LGFLNSSLEIDNICGLGGQPSQSSAADSEEWSLTVALKALCRPSEIGLLKGYCIERDLSTLGAADDHVKALYSISTF